MAFRFAVSPLRLSVHLCRKWLYRLCYSDILRSFMIQAFGVVGVISDGPSRDIDEIRPMGIQYMLTGVTAGHGAFSVKAINVPVNICGMDVCPGDIIHMDENGCVKFPVEYIKDVYEKALKLQQVESKRQSKMAASNDVEEIIRIMAGFEDN